MTCNQGLWNAGRTSVRIAEAETGTSVNQGPHFYARLDHPLAEANANFAAFVGLRYSPGF